MQKLPTIGRDKYILKLQETNSFTIKIRGDSLEKKSRLNICKVGFYPGNVIYCLIRQNLIASESSPKALCKNITTNLVQNVLPFQKRFSFKLSIGDISKVRVVRSKNACTQTTISCLI